MEILIKKNCYNCGNRPKCCEIGPNLVGCNGKNNKWIPVK